MSKPTPPPDYRHMKKGECLTSDDLYFSDKEDYWRITKTPGLIITASMVGKYARKIEQQSSKQDTPQTITGDHW